MAELQKGHQTRGKQQEQEFSPTSELRTYTSLQALFLTRLERLIQLRARYGKGEAREAWMLRALEKALYSTFVDCITQGVGEEARSLLSGKTFPS